MRAFILNDPSVLKMPRHHKPLEIDINLTAYQIHKVLDILLISGIDCLLRHTNLVDKHLSGVLRWVLRNKRQKISNIDRSLQISCMINLLVATDPRQKLKYYRRLRPDRYISFGLLDLAVTALSDYQAPNERIEREVGCGSEHLEAVKRHVEDCRELAYQFRNLIIAKYLPLCRQEAVQIREAAKGPSISVNDLSQNLVAALMLGLDKFDHRKGALTSYIRQWMRHIAQSTAKSHEMGLAYDVPHNFKRQMGRLGVANIGESYDRIRSNESLNPTEFEGPSRIDMDSDGEASSEQAGKSVHHHFQENEKEQRLLSIMKVADPKGIVRLALGIEEFMSEKDKEKMRKQMVKQGVSSAIP